ncbi:MAG: hypothetical protein HQL94_11675 [Magnetococcales bacterium]|nr:hypothetical protein [Magnetococcales bacterium]
MQHYPFFIHTCGVLQNRFARESAIAMRRLMDLEIDLHQQGSTPVNTIYG